MKFTLFLGLSLFGLISCNNHEVNSSPLTLKSLGKWAFINKSEPLGEYAEDELIDNQFITIRTLHFSSKGYYEYNIKKELLIINRQTFQIVSLSDTKIELISGKDEYVCYKIVLDDIILYNDQIDPFYLRQCYFLEHAGFMTKRDALQYISDNRWIPIDSIPKEMRVKEIMLIDNSKKAKAKQIK